MLAAPCFPNHHIKSPFSSQSASPTRSSMVVQARRPGFNKLRGNLHLTVLTAVLFLCVALPTLTGIVVRHEKPVRPDRRRRLPQACNFFFSRAKYNSPGHLASMYAADATSQGGCVPYAYPCDRQVLHTHTWLRTFDFKDESASKKLILLLRAWMITQDLRRSCFNLWISSIKDNHLPAWLEEYAPYVVVRHFSYDKESASTPLALSRHFATLESFNKTFTTDHAEKPGMVITSTSNVVRNLILHNYGGLWLDSDAVPLRDLWEITVGLGLAFMSKLKGHHANNHVIYVPCSHSALAKRRLQTITMFNWQYPDAWPIFPSSGTRLWVYNDGLSEQIRRQQAIMYNNTNDGEEINPDTLPETAWSDLEVPFPIHWFDPSWGRATDSDEFRRSVICERAFLWHRLTKHGKNQSFGPHSGCDELWAEILETMWTVDPKELTGGVTCPKTEHP
jgi:hypothetical protein